MYTCEESVCCDDRFVVWIHRNEFRASGLGIWYRDILGHIGARSPSVPNPEGIVWCNKGGLNANEGIIGGHS